MNKSNPMNPERRRLIKLLGGGVTFLSVAGLAACSDNKSESPAPAKTAATEPKTTQPSKSEPMPEPAPEPAAEMADETVAATPDEPAMADNGPPHLSEDNPQAKALGYHNDSTTVDAAKWPKHAAGQACGNCALFVGKPGESWGNCGIFPGNQVNVGGWCSAYNKKA